MTFTLHTGDAVTWLASLPSGSVDLAITDPAYESLEKHRAKGTTTRLKHSAASSNDWFAIFPNARFPELLGELYRVLVDDAHCYVYCDPETAFVAKPIAERAGFHLVQPLVWDKVTIGMGYHYRARYELVLLFEKGLRPVADPELDDMIAAKRIRNGYPTEKPVEVSEVFVRQSSAPGQLVIDPFMGSGSVGEATLRQGRRFAGNDLSPASVDLARARLKSLAGGRGHLGGAGGETCGLGQTRRENEAAIGGGRSRR